MPNDKTTAWRAAPAGNLYGRDGLLPAQWLPIFHFLGTVWVRSGYGLGTLPAPVAHIDPQNFRHTFATWAIEAEAREIDVQFLMGHSTPVMVRRYIAT